MRNNKNTIEIQAGQNKKNNLWQESKSLIYIILLALLIRSLIFEIFYVPTGSMKSTILEGDYIFATKYSYGYSRYSFPFSPKIIKDKIFASKPNPGDVVITKSAHNMSVTFIKRLIGMPGDKIEIIQDVIYINSQPIKRQEVGIFVDDNGKKYKKFLETLPNGVRYYSMKISDQDNHIEPHNFGPYYIPQNHYFLLGDNRDNSGDSRYQIGFVPAKYIVAKARFIIFSTKEAMWDMRLGVIDQFKQIGKWFANIRFNRLGRSLQETR